MFYIENLKKARRLIIHETSQKFNQLSNVFIFDEVSANIIGLNEKLYDSAAEEPIAGQNITVGFIMMKNHAFNFENTLTYILSKILGFNLIKFKTNNGWELDNKLLRDEIDFIAASFASPTYPELVSTAVTKQELYMRQPHADFTSTFFIRVFDVKLWYTVAGIIVASLVVLSFYKLLLNRFKFNFVEAIYYTLGMADLRNSEDMGISLRVACFFISFFMFLIMAAFSTFLTIELTVREIKLPFHSLDEIRHQTEYGYCVPMDTVGFTSEIEQGNEKLINKGNCPKDRVLNYKFIKSICGRKKTIYIISSDNFYSEINDQFDGHPPCDIYVFKNVIPPVHRILTSKRNFKYTRQFRRIITRMRTSGLLEFVHKTVVGIDRGQLHTNEPEDVIAVEYDHIKLILLIYISFMVISIVILVLEAIYSTLSRK